MTRAETLLSKHEEISYVAPLFYLRIYDLLYSCCEANICRDLVGDALRLASRSYGKFGGLALSFR